MKYKKIGFIICTLFIVFIGAQCNKGNNDSNEVVKIGVIAPLTGDGASYGASMKRGIDLAFKNDSLIHLIYEDDKLDSKEGVTIINKLINIDKVKVVLGSAASGVTISLAPIAEKNKVILFSTISTSDNLKTAGDYFFRNVPRNEIQGKTAAEFLFYSKKVKTAGIYSENDEYGTNLSKSFKSKFEELGGIINFEDSYSSGQSDFKTALVRAKSSGIQALFIPGNYKESAIILKQARELNLNIFIIGGDGSYSPELITIGGNALEGFCLTLMSVDKESEYYKNFLNDFTKKYSKEPDIYDAYAFEGGMIILEAIKKVGYDADKIKQYLYSTTFKSMTGDLKFDIDGEVQRNYGITEVQNGKFQEISTK